MKIKYPSRFGEVRNEKIGREEVSRGTGVKKTENSISSSIGISAGVSDSGNTCNNRGYLSKFISFAGISFVSIVLRVPFFSLATGLAFPFLAGTRRKEKEIGKSITRSETRSTSSTGDVHRTGLGSRGRKTDSRCVEAASLSIFALIPGKFTRKQRFNLHISLERIPRGSSHSWWLQQRRAGCLRPTSIGGVDYTERTYRSVERVRVRCMCVRVDVRAYVYSFFFFFVRIDSGQSLIGRSMRLHSLATDPYFFFFCR